MHPRRINWIIRCVLAGVLGILASGCRSPEHRNEIGRTGVLSWNPHLLFLNQVPHDSLYVEVDAVAGTEPGAEVLAELERFLRRYCDKPGGITVARDDVIARTAAAGYHHEALALQYLDGPQSVSNSNPAFIYVLYFDSSLRPDTGKPERSAVHKHTRLRVDSRYVDPVSPHVNPEPYPAAIYIDERFLRTMPRQSETLIIRHEAAHVLGLTRNPNHGAEYHCTRRQCLMASHLNIGFFKLILGRYPFVQTNLCEACDDDLVRGRNEQSTNVRFAGPVLVRSEREYFVGSLPAEVSLGAGDSTRFDVAKFLKRARDDGRRMKGQFSHRYWADYSAEPAEVERQIKQMAEAQQDPLPIVRDAARQLGARAQEALDQARGKPKPRGKD